MISKQFHDISQPCNDLINCEIFLLINSIAVILKLFLLLFGG